MRRLLLLSAALALSSAPLGCGADNSVNSIEVSPEAKKADEGAQKGMQEYFKTKGQPRPKG